MRLLLVEDKEVLCITLKKLFEKENIELDICHDGIEGLELALIGDYSVIILDIMLPSLSGVEILKELRMKSVPTPVLMLTARDTVTDKVSALDCGADDYIVKPFEFLELNARIRALSRRSPIIKQEPDRVVGYTSINQRSFEVKMGETVVKTTKKEALLLDMLFQNVGEIILKEHLLMALCGQTKYITTNNVDVYIYNIRKKFPPELSGFIIETKHAQGYLIIESHKRDG